MKLHILSDTHGQTVTLHPDADLIVHAGDFGNGRRGAEAFQAACAAAGKPCVFVLGNHDFYGEHLDELPRELIAAGAPLLTANRPLEFGGYTFVGGTLFSNFRLPWVNKKQFRENLALARRNIADFSTSPQAKRRTSAAPNPKTTSSALMPNSISSSISATERAPSCSPTFRRTPPAPRRSMPIRP
ncbi:metallophosphoesterase [uncultured Kingella sp.]|uniref:metallophosphoesterase family protein n=1 Tax=uncultured Kingella sp. TaxID=159270 RepID=UPI00259AC255|nr:metallophosphoesterase [uncultured Kingella sp.]